MLSLQSDEFGGSYRTAMDELDNANNGGTITSTKDALDAVYTSLKNAGVPLDELNNKLSKDFLMQLSQQKLRLKRISLGHRKPFLPLPEKHLKILQQQQMKWQRQLLMILQKSRNRQTLT